MPDPLSQDERERLRQLAGRTITRAIGSDSALATGALRLLASLDAAEKALQRNENDWCFLFNLTDELLPEVRHALAKANLDVTRAALSRLGAGGEEG